MNFIADALKLIFSSVRPFLAGFLIAYILALPCDNIEKLFIRKFRMKYRLADILSVIITEILAVLFITLFCIVILPQCYFSILKIIANIPEYLNSLNAIIDDFIRNNSLLRAFGVGNIEHDTNLQEYLISSLSSDLSEISTEIYNGATKVWTLITDTIVAYVSSVFILFNRHKAVKAFRLLLYTVFKNKSRKFVKILGESNQIFRKFVFGKAIDSLIIGILTFIILAMMHFPYTVFNATFVGITNMIPIFGPIIGAIPGFLIILIESPINALKFALVILAIQQFDGHLLGPKLLGGQLGISTYWVLFAVIVFGRLFGVVGMFFGVPVFATIYSTIRSSVSDTYAEMYNKRAALKKIEED